MSITIRIRLLCILKNAETSRLISESPKNYYFEFLRTRDEANFVGKVAYLIYRLTALWHILVLLQKHNWHLVIERYLELRNCVLGSLIDCLFLEIKKKGDGKRQSYS